MARRLMHKKPEPGEWFRVMRDMDYVCCDCGLWHRAETRVRAGKIWQRMWRSEAQTAGKRTTKKKLREGVFKTWR